jgi:hypothetical protein
MQIDLTAAAGFMAAHARLLDRHRFAVRFAGGAPEGVLAALDAYRNADGGYGWGLEPDLRAPGSQPGGALHAFEALAEVAPATSARAVGLCEWLAAASLPDGGLPFALPVADATGVAPFWAEADPGSSSLHITAAVAAAAHAVARSDPGVARHPWLERATAYCLDAIAALERPGGTLELLYSLQLLDALAGDDDVAAGQLERLVSFVPRDGVLGVEGGAEGEAIRPLDLAPWPDRPIRGHLAPDLVARDLDRLAGEQRDDGGWAVDFHSYSPAAALEWRGYVTVSALMVLDANRRLEGPSTKSV